MYASHNFQLVMSLLAMSLGHRFWVVLHNIAFLYNRYIITLICTILLIIVY